MASVPRVATPKTSAPARTTGETIIQVDGQEVKLSPATVKQFLVSGNGAVTDQEVMMFMALCKAQHLNPFVKDAYLIKYGDQPAAIVTSVGALEKRAVDFPEFDGIKSGIVVMLADGSYENREGTCYSKATETLIGGWAEVKRKDRPEPTFVSLMLDEYIQRKKDGTPNTNWATKPATMIRKCAKAAAYREAFPKQNNGLYDLDEIKSESVEVSLDQIAPMQDAIEMNANTGEIFE